MSKQKKLEKEGLPCSWTECMLVQTTIQVLVLLISKTEQSQPGTGIRSLVFNQIYSRHMGAIEIYN